MNTVLLALLAASAEGIAIFKTFGGVKRVGADAAGIQLDITLYWPIRTAAEAKQLESVIAGASAMYEDRDSRDDDDPAKSDYSVTRKFADDARHVTLNLVQEGADGGGRVILSDQSCSVVQAKVTTSKKAASYEVKLRTYGLTSKQVGDLAEGLTASVGVSLIKDQASIFDSAGSNVVKLNRSIAPKLGQVASGKLSSGLEFAGLIKEISTDGIVLVEDLDGGSVEVSTAQISSALNIGPPKGKTMEWVADELRKKCDKRGNRPTWGSVLTALGEVHAENLTPTETWTVSSSILEAASKICPKAEEQVDKAAVN